MIRIDILPDDVLLEIFDEYHDSIIQSQNHGLRHCNRCSCVSKMEKPCLCFGLPRRLNLQLFQFVHPKHPQTTHRTSGHPCLSSSRVIWPLHRAWTTSLLHLGTAIAYGKSTSGSAMGKKSLAAMQEHEAAALVIPDSFLGRVDLRWIPDC